MHAILRIASVFSLIPGIMILSKAQKVEHFEQITRTVGLKFNDYKHNLLLFACYYKSHRNQSFLSSPSHLLKSFISVFQKLDSVTDQQKMTDQKYGYPYPAQGGIFFIYEPIKKLISVVLYMFFQMFNLHFLFVALSPDFNYI